MRAVFGYIALTLALATLVAWRITDNKNIPGKIVMTWVTDDNPTRRDQIALFNKKYPQYELRLDANNQGIDKILVQSSSGVGPDLFDSYGIAYLQIFVRTGIAWDVTDELKKRSITPELTWPVAWPSFVYQGRVYGFPCNVNAGGIWYHKDLFDKAHLPHPKPQVTWEEFLDLAQKMTIKKNGKITRYGFMGDLSEAFMFSNGGRFFNDTGTRCVLDSTENREAIQFWVDLMYKYQVVPTPSAEVNMATKGGWGSGDITLFGDKRCAMASGGRWWLNTLRVYKNLHLGVFEIPRRKQIGVHGGSRCTIINAKSPHREAALDFLTYLASPEYSRLVNDQADAFGPLRQLETTPEFFFNPDFPQEDYNRTWAGILDTAGFDQISPFVSPNIVSDRLQTQLDMARNLLKSPAEALKKAQEDINGEIQHTISKDENLRKKYEETIAMEKASPSKS